MKYQVFLVPALAVVGVFSTRSSAIAVEFNFTTVQERSSEVIEQGNIIENFRALQQERLNSQEELIEGDFVEEESTEGNATDTTQLVPEFRVPEAGVSEAELVDTPTTPLTDR